MNQRRQPNQDYETVTRSKQQRRFDSSTIQESPKRPAAKFAEPTGAPVVIANELPRVIDERTFLKRGHVLSFAALFVFTLVLYARPAEFYPSAATRSLALIVGVITLAIFIATQLTLEGKLTALSAEVNYALLFLGTGLLSIPLAIDPATAWGEFSGTFVRGVLIFIIIVNAVRTPTRLKALLFLSIATALVLSVQAINDYRLGLNVVEGYRAAGRGNGIFGNTNDMALFLVTSMPFSVAFFFGSKGGLRKCIHAACVLMMLFGVVLSYSRGAFLGVLVLSVFFALKIGRRSKIEVIAVLIVGTLAMVVLAPSGYGDRLLSIFLPGLDPNGSADARRGELFRSIYVAVRHPLLGIGMGNYQPNMSNNGLVTHNSYTQVAAEMGLLALGLYTMFVVTPIRKLAVIARQSFSARETSEFYYLALGLQASLLVFMVSSFFLSVAFAWNIYYLVGYAVCFRRIYESETGQFVALEKRKKQKQDEKLLDESIQHPAIA